MAMVLKRLGVIIKLWCSPLALLSLRNHGVVYQQMSILIQDLIVIPLSHSKQRLHTFWIMGAYNQLVLAG